jgi:hypothetical protein
MTGRPGAAEHTSSAQAPVEVVTLRQRPDLTDQVEALHEGAWDVFLDKGASWDSWEPLFDVFANFQVVLCDADGTAVGVGHTVPFTWDGTMQDLPSTLDDAIMRGLDDGRSGRASNTLCALAAVVKPTHHQRGLSTLIVRSMAAVAAEHGAQSVVVPVGPTLKHLYPLTPMERYMRWTRADGAPFDPWVRVHWRLGAELLCVAPTTTICVGTVADWEEWTGLSFPESGPYVVRDALQPVMIDRERDTGRYDDPGIWMLHRVRRDAT